ncbi:MAG TPA: NADH:flavin oxidoreductase, partial [Xanthobacteraceae bacterium]|nr:NADH:flavin oxidoreductase [Xanthobacteraceae bacterium]
MRPGNIGGLVVKNRLIRAATSETMATASGEATDELVRLYSDLARGGAGLIITGHIYVEPRGQYEPRQLGLDRDERVAPLARVTDAVHRHGGRIFAELSHAGSQSLIPEIVPLAPSIVPNAIFARPPVEMTKADIGDVIAGFADAAARAQRAGFDGVHLHSGNGYLLSQFNSPFANRRDDHWGGDPQRRARFILEVYRAMRRATGVDFPVTARLGLADAVADGLAISDGLS